MALGPTCGAACLPACLPACISSEAGKSQWVTMNLEYHNHLIVILTSEGGILASARKKTRLHSLITSTFVGSVTPSVFG
ncbi:hypothetical protein K504DRAFT_196160 [Pleomassaria siparia CBS 279.74]|uniref:Uncharacterized protein n=1 Tax=Pleomassaria siparia CBS 279.74 TaxID=1314801 RepID=A0A6G1KH84_9PLEO|nr:hypothetical protein K504DRAFT_196160 [Pleomassaria siparia CBS 279.74]